MNKYNKMLKRIYKLQNLGIKLGLSSTKKLLQRLGNPHFDIKCIHLAGTNGKGSIGAILEATLLATGIKVGFYSSPHLINFNERIRLSGIEINETQFIKIAEIIWSVVDLHNPPSFFEFVTVLAFLYYAQQNTELVILETGLGGRLDATNVCYPLATVITNIGLEHQEQLGYTLASIAFEKAGIIKSNIPIVHGITQLIARQVIEKYAIDFNAPIIRLGRDIKLRRYSDSTFDLYGRFWKINKLKTKLIGRHQPINAALALAVIEILVETGILIRPHHFREGLIKTNWPGRLELLPKLPNEPLIWLDGAHNLPAARILLNNLDLVRSNRSPLVLVLGIMADKNYRRIITKLVPAVDRVIYTRPVYKRAVDPKILAAVYPHKIPSGTVIQNLKQALKQAKYLAGPKGVILITGSLYTIGEAFVILRKMHTSAINLG